MLYYGARYYNPAVGRFTQADPVVVDNVGRKEFAMALANPQMLNGYSYVGNNPMKYEDSEGEFAILVPAVAYAVAYAPVWAPAVVTAVGAAGGAIASWYYGNALGYYSQGANQQGDAAIGNEMLTLEATAMAMSGVMSVERMGSAGTVNQHNDAQPLKSIPSEGKIDPSKVRFTQNSVSSMIHGKDGQLYPLKDLTQGLKNGTIKPSDVPQVRLFEKDNQLWSLDNRRPQAFKDAGMSMPYRSATPLDIAQELEKKMTTQNQGVSVKIRGGGK